MIDDVMLEAEEKMGKAIDVARNEFGKIRSGRANPEMFTSLIVEYYGAPTPLQQTPRHRVGAGSSYCGDLAF